MSDMSKTALDKYAGSYPGEVVVSDGVHTLENNAFWGCEKSVRILKCSDSVKTIGECLFMGGTYPTLKTVELGQGIEVIGRAAFAGCNDLSEVTFGQSLKRIEECAFQYCLRLLDMDFSNTQLEFIGTKAFEHSGIKSVVLPNTLKHIGDYAFSYSHIESIEIPPSVETIGEKALNTCKDVTLFDSYRTRFFNLFDDFGNIKYRTPYKDHFVTIRTTDTADVLHQLFFSGDEGDDYHQMIWRCWKNTVDFDFETYDIFFLNLKTDRSKKLTAETKLILFNNLLAI